MYVLLEIAEFRTLILIEAVFLHVCSRSMSELVRLLYKFVCVHVRVERALFAHLGMHAGTSASAHELRAIESLCCFDPLILMPCRQLPRRQRSEE